MLKIIRVKIFCGVKFSRFRSIREIVFDGWLLQYGQAAAAFSLLGHIRRARYR